MAEKRQKVHPSLDLTSLKVLRQMEAKHLFGHNISQITGAIIQQWIWTNRRDLREEGIRLTEEAGEPPDKTDNSLTK